MFLAIISARHLHWVSNKKYWRWLLMWFFIAEMSCDFYFFSPFLMHRILKSVFRLWKLGLPQFPLTPNSSFPHFSSRWALSHNICTCRQTLAQEKGRVILHNLLSNSVSVFCRVSVTPRIPLSLNNLGNACVFLQPETMISPLPPNARAHLSSRRRSLPPHLSAVAPTPLHHSQVASGTRSNRGRLS